MDSIIPNASSLELPSPQLAATSGATSSSSSKGDFDKWFDKTKDRLLDLSATDTSVIKFTAEEFAKASPEKRLALQQLIDSRSQVTSSITQILRTMAESARQVIANMR